MMSRVYMNGTDYMMSVFDRQLRTIGCSGNLSHLILGVPLSPDGEALRARLVQVGEALPMLSARQKRGWFSLLPYWQLPTKNARRPPSLRTVSVDSMKRQSLETLRAAVFNESLDVEHGELVRFTVLQAADRAEVIMTWAHALMDARGGETLLSWIGGGACAKASFGRLDPRKAHTRRAVRREGVWHDMRQAWKALRWLDHIGTPPPLSIYTARASQAQPRQSALYLSFSEEETATIRTNSSGLCGFLGETNYYLASTLVELDRLCVSCGIPAESYIVNLPSNARDKGSNEPVFSNYSSFITHYLRKNQVSDLGAAIQALQFQTRESLGMKLGVAFDCFGTLVRRIPPKPYWDRMKIALNDELGSMFFANTGNAHSELDRFLGQDVRYLHHATSVTCPPGLGVFFHTFKSRLCCTIMLIEGLLDKGEESSFAAHLRQRLLHPMDAVGGDA